jgi:EryCIII-like glycosyltransferase
MYAAGVGAPAAISLARAVTSSHVTEGGEQQVVLRREVSHWTVSAGATRTHLVMAGATTPRHVYPSLALISELVSRGHHARTCPGKVDAVVLCPLPDGVQVPRTQRSSTCSHTPRAFITHAGMGSAAESPWFGVPIMAIAPAVDRFANAARLQDVGAGVQLRSEDVDAERVGASGRARQDAARARAEDRRSAVPAGLPSLQTPSSAPCAATPQRGQLALGPRDDRRRTLIRVIDRCGTDYLGRPRRTGGRVAGFIPICLRPGLVGHVV